MPAALTRRLRSARRYAREFGPAYALLVPARTAAQKAVRRIDDGLLTIEGRRGILGPAHRSWTGNDHEDNRRVWSEWDWSARGEEWTASAEWKQALIDEVLLPTIPAGGTVMEIGPGGGRWTEILHPRAERMILVDVTETTLELCRRHLGDPPGVEYVVSPGAALPGVADRSVDAVWSFDVFVHVAPTDQAAYLAEIARVLRAGGVAAIHHADGRNRGTLPSRRGWRAPMSATLFSALARDCGLEVDRVITSWSGGRHDLSAFADAITVLRAPTR